MTTNKTATSKKQTPPQQSQSQTGSKGSPMRFVTGNRTTATVSKHSAKPHRVIIFDSADGK